MLLLYGNRHVLSIRLLPSRTVLVVLSHIYASSGYSAITENTPSEVQNGNSTNLLNIHATNLGTTTVANGITNALSKDIEGLFVYY